MSIHTVSSKHIYRLTIIQQLQYVVRKLLDFIPVLWGEGLHILFMTETIPYPYYILYHAIDIARKLVLHRASQLTFKAEYKHVMFESRLSVSAEVEDT